MHKRTGRLSAPQKPRIGPNRSSISWFLQRASREFVACPQSLVACAMSLDVCEHLWLGLNWGQCQHSVICSYTIQTIGIHRFPVPGSQYTAKWLKWLGQQELWRAQGARVLILFLFPLQIRAYFGRLLNWTTSHESIVSHGGSFDPCRGWLVVGNYIECA